MKLIIYAIIFGVFIFTLNLAELQYNFKTSVKKILHELAGLGIIPVQSKHVN